MLSEKKRYVYGAVVEAMLDFWLKILKEGIEDIRKDLPRGEVTLEDLRLEALQEAVKQTIRELGVETYKKALEAPKPVRDFWLRTGMRAVILYAHKWIPVYLLHHLLAFHRSILIKKNLIPKVSAYRLLKKLEKMRSTWGELDSELGEIASNLDSLGYITALLEIEEKAREVLKKVLGTTTY